ncbi:MAG: TolC family protein [Rikenellaceae bacterium]|nr:TolC family protein [Rikenellaceae bacterium]
MAQNEVSLTNAENDLELSRLNLVQLLNLSERHGFEIREPEQEHLLARNRATTFSPDDIFDIALGIKPHIREAEYRLEGSKRQVKIAQSSLYTTLNLSMSYNTGYSHIFNSDREIDPFFTQFRHNRREAIGLSMSVPIFNRLQTRNQIRSAKLSMENRLLQLDQVKLSLYKEIQQAHQSALAAEAKYRATDTAMEAAQQAYRYAEERYDVGKSTVYEFNEAQSNLVYSQSEQIQAKYDYLFRAKILDFYRGEPLEIR